MTPFQINPAIYVATAALIIVPIFLNWLVKKRKARKIKEKNERLKSRIKEIFGMYTFETNKITAFQNLFAGLQNAHKNNSQFPAIFDDVLYHEKGFGAYKIIEEVLKEMNKEKSFDDYIALAQFVEMLPTSRNMNGFSEENVQKFWIEKIKVRIFKDCMNVDYPDTERWLYDRLSVFCGKYSGQPLFARPALANSMIGKELHKSVVNNIQVWMLRMNAVIEQAGYKKCDYFSEFRKMRDVVLVQLFDKNSFSKDPLRTLRSELKKRHNTILVGIIENNQYYSLKDKYFTDLYEGLEKDTIRYRIVPVN